MTAVPECFVRTFEPEDGNGRTIILVHGYMHTGEHYVQTLDGRPGWAADFAAAGYRVLVPDWPGVGRSPAIDPSLFSSAYMCQGLGRVIESVDGPIDLLVHSMSGPYGIALLDTHGDRIDHLVAAAPGQPFELAAAPDLVDDTGDDIRTVQGGVEFRMPKQPTWVEPSREFVVDKLVGTDTLFPPYSVEAYLETLVPMWSGFSHERLAAISVPKHEQPPPTPLDGQRVLVMTGTNDRDHTREADGLIVDWLRTRGATVTFDYLGDRGVVGNGHMLMLDRNSAELAASIVDWLGVA